MSEYKIYDPSLETDFCNLNSDANYGTHCSEFKSILKQPKNPGVTLAMQENQHRMPIKLIYFQRYLEVMGGASVHLW